MSVTSLIPVGVRDGNYELKDYTRKFVVQYKVVCDSADDDATTIKAYLATQGLDLAEPHAIDTGALCASMSIRQSQQLKGGHLWEVSLTYDSQADPNQFSSPILRPTKWKITFAKGKEAVLTDLNGDALLNSSFDPFIPPVELETSEVRITAEKNFSRSAFSFLDIYKYRGSVNDATWKGFPIAAVKIDGIEYQEEVDNNIEFAKYTFNFSLKLEENTDGSGNITYTGGWRPTQVVDMGMQYVDFTTGRKKPILDNRGQPKTTPTLLDGLGGVLPQGASPVKLDFIFHRLKDFSTFAL